jgi:hypothetical protein
VIRERSSLALAGIAALLCGCGNSTPLGGIGADPSPIAPGEQTCTTPEPPAQFPLDLVAVASYPVARGGLPVVD